MIDRILVRPDVYRDSVKLMLVSRSAADRPGVTAAVVAMATPINLQLAAAQGFGLAGEPGPDDLLIAVRAADEATADAVLAEIEREIDEVVAPAAASSVGFGSVAHAVRIRPGINIAVISVPGPNAAVEVALALDAGLHVFCFSDGVSADDERLLKKRAAADGLLLMGPDCGTAIVDGVGFGFANVVRRGRVGIVGASGTGIQELSCLLDAAGIGISHAIGVGGRDLSLGGLMTIRALELLASDELTEEIVVVTKPAETEALERVGAHAHELGVTALFALPGARELPESLNAEDTIEGVAAQLAAGSGRSLPYAGSPLEFTGSTGFVRGLFCGGTLALEAAGVLARELGAVYSNVPLTPDWSLENIEHGVGHSIVDFGDDELTAGRAHPIIDSTLRFERLRAEAEDPDVSVLLLDLVLGHGAGADPAGELAAELRGVLEKRRDMTVIVSVCGAAGDPQGLDDQMAKLRSAGARVTRSCAAAAKLALCAIGTGGVARA
jgi:FdrA protein